MVGDDEEYKRQTCVDCKATSPPIHTNYTLIGSHGWRFMRVPHGDMMIPMWRCPACYAAYKKKHDEPISSRPIKK
jgi:hypothetical protein